MTAEPLHREPSHSDELVELTIPISTDLFAALKIAAFQRRSLGQSEPEIEELILEAIAGWLEQEMSGTATVTIRI